MQDAKLSPNVLRDFAAEVKLVASYGGASARFTVAGALLSTLAYA